MSSMDPWTIEASAPGKVILHGEHSVVYGKTGVVVSIDLRTKTLLRPNHQNRKCLTVCLPDLGRTYDFATDSLVQFMRCHSNLLLDASSSDFDDVSFEALKAQIVAFVDNNYPDLQAAKDKAGQGITALLFLYFAMVYENGRGVEPLYLEITSDIPIGAGLGSSAAYSVSLATAFYRHLVLKAPSSSGHETETDSCSGDDTSSEHSSAGSSIKGLASPDLHRRNGSVVTATSVTAINGDAIAAANAPEDMRMRKDICQWAFLGEKILHGNPSGIDNSICTYGGLLAFRSGKIQSMREKPILPMRIILVNSRVSRNTRFMIGKVRERIRVCPLVTEPIMEALDNIAKQCLDTIDHLEDIERQQNGVKATVNPAAVSTTPPTSTDGATPTFKSATAAAADNNNIENTLNNAYVQKSFAALEHLVEANHGLLSALGVSHPRLDEVQAVCKKHGFHAKLTGAGGGGFAFALVTPSHNQSQIDDVTHALTAEGFECWETKIATKGATIHS